MKWRKLGVVWNTDGKQAWARSHAMGPTPFLLNPDVIRVFITCLDEKGRGRPGFVDVCAHEPTRVLGTSDGPVMDIGEPGCFDDNGLMATSIIRLPTGKLWMYYAGFEICTNIRYRILSGVASSNDDGRSFERISAAPVLERTHSERFFRCGPFMFLDEQRFKLWYIAGGEWTELNGKPMPVYDLRYQESDDGLSWSDQGILSMALTQEDEHGFGRPWVVKVADGGYRLFYSIRRRSLGAYRLGYAESRDGIHWERKDEEMGLDVDDQDIASTAIMYSAVIEAHGKTYCFYNGDNFGQAGFAVAELLP